MFKVTMHYRITCATYFIYRKSLKGIIANFPGICTLRIFYGEIFFYSMKCKRNCYSALQRAKHFPDQEALIQLAEYFDVTIDYLLGRTPYRYNPEVLRQECVPGTTVSDVVEVIQHFNPKNMASLLDFVDLLQLREKAESSSREDSAND